MNNDIMLHRVGGNVVNSAGDHVFLPPDTSRFDEHYDNAERLVACWNACRGISTEALNAGVVSNAIAECRGVVRVWDRDKPTHWEERPSGDGVRPHIIVEQYERISRIANHQ